MSQRRAGWISRRLTKWVLPALALTLLPASVGVVRATPAGAAAGVITVTPSTGLVDGQTVAVHGSGWVPGHAIRLIECHSEALSACDLAVPSFIAGSTGAFDGSLTVKRLLGTLDCAAPAIAEKCSALAIDTNEPLPVVAAAALSFAPAPPVILPRAASVIEGNSATTSLVVPVGLSFASSSTVTVHWVTNSAPGAPVGQADPATDFTPASGNLSFAPGSTAQSLTISVNGDTLIEPDESIVVTFTLATNATVGSFTLPVIRNDDRVVVLPGGAIVSEGNSATTNLVVPLTLSNPSAQTVTVQWRTAFTANPAPPQADPVNDFTATSGVVTFVPGDTAESVTITVNGDTVVEPGEWIVISFHHPTNAFMGGYWGLGFGGIANDD